MDKKEKSFEYYMKELDKIIAEMENGGIDQLEKLVMNFEHGSEIINKCNKMLKEAEMRVYRVRENEAESFEAGALKRKNENRVE
jgi:exodeoxyribonuclease VII small subunit